MRTLVKVARLHRKLSRMKGLSQENVSSANALQMHHPKHPYTAHHSTSHGPLISQAKRHTATLPDTTRYARVRTSKQRVVGSTPTGRARDSRPSGGWGSRRRAVLFPAPDPVVKMSCSRDQSLRLSSGTVSRTGCNCQRILHTLP